MRNMFKVNNKNTRTITITSFWFFYWSLRTYFTSFSGVSFVDFGEVNVIWVTWNKVFSGPWQSLNILKWCVLFKQTMYVFIFLKTVFRNFFWSISEYYDTFTFLVSRLSPGAPGLRHWKKVSILNLPYFDYRTRYRILAKNFIH